MNSVQKASDGVLIVLERISLDAQGRIVQHFAEARIPSGYRLARRWTETVEAPAVAAEADSGPTAE